MKGISLEGDMMDVTAPSHVQIEVQTRPSGLVVYVHVEGRTVFRACQVTLVEYTPPEEEMQAVVWRPS